VAAATVEVPIRALYRRLLAAYGPQGWWPIPASAGRRGFDARGYHAGDYRTPFTPAARFQVILGAVLTQNTAWTNAAAALDALGAAGVRLPTDVLTLPRGRLARLVRSSGYFNQKARKLALVARFFRGPGALRGSAAPSRQALLSLWGVGPETADSILLYAFQEPVFVVDAYTRRIFSRVGLIGGRESYDDIQAVFHRCLRPDAAVYNEYHALIVEHAKRHCAVRPRCEACPVKRCGYRDTVSTARP
jgi:endonuclease III related protein